MQRLLATAILASCFSLTQAHAAPVTVEYKAKVTTLAEGNTQVESSDKAGFNIAVGETITGHFSYDSATPMFWWGSSWPVQYGLDHDVVSSLKFANSSETFVFDQGFTGTTQADYLAVSTDLHGQAGNMGASFVHNGPYTWLDAHMPEADQWAGFSTTQSVITFAAAGGDPQETMWLNASVYSFSVMPSVPEPTTYMMLGAGLGMMALARRNRRTSPNAQAL